MHSTYIAIERMSVEKGGKGGIIANVASIAGLDYLFNAPAYTATKHAIIGFTRALGVSMIKFTPFLTNNLVGLYRLNVQVFLILSTFRF